MKVLRRLDAINEQRPSEQMSEARRLFSGSSKNNYAVEPEDFQSPQPTAKTQSFTQREKKDVSPVSIFDLCSALRDEEAPNSPSTPPSSSPCIPPETPMAVFRHRFYGEGEIRSRLHRKNSLQETKVLLTTRLEMKNDFLFSENFDFLQVLGRGAFSEVFKAKHRENGELYAVKKSCRPFRGRKDREIYLHEVKSVAALAEHDNIVNYYRCWQDNGYFWVQMEYCDGGDLKSFVQTLGRRLTEGEIWHFLRQVSAGLDYLHENNVLHFDIKPENIFIRGGTLKIGDFGLAVRIGEWEHGEGDCAYMAPELLHEGAEIGMPADVFSLGLMAYEWATNCVVPPNGPLWQALRSGQADISSEMDRSDELAHLISAMLHPDPQARSTAAHVLEYSFEMSRRHPVWL